MGFLLFLLVNFTLFVRPADFIPGIIGLPIYNALMLACLAVSLPAVLGQLNGKSLHGRPVTVGVLAMFAAVVFSHLHRFDIYSAREAASSFVKVVLYYALLVGLVDTTGKLRRFLFWLGWFVTVMAAITLLEYHGVIHVANSESMQHMAEVTYDEDGEVVASVGRLFGAGIFNNPNALARILVTAILVSLYWLTDRRSGLFRLTWLVPLGVLGYALLLTRSRGGLMDLIAALGTLFILRFGWKRAALLGVLVLPALLVVAGGRQTELSTNAETAQERIKLWREGWMLFTQDPLLGIGMGQFSENVGMVAHNSFFHCFTELGLFGGTVYAGLFYLALRPAFDPAGFRTPGDPELERLRPFVMAIIAGEAVGMWSISRSYDTPTYMLLGIAAVYQRLATADRPVVDGRLLGRVVLVGFGTLAVLYVFVKLNAG